MRTIFLPVVTASISFPLSSFHIEILIILNSFCGTYILPMDFPIARSKSTQLSFLKGHTPFSYHTFFSTWMRPSALGPTSLPMKILHVIQEPSCEGTVALQQDNLKVPALCVLKKGWCCIKHMWSFFRKIEWVIPFKFLSGPTWHLFGKEPTMWYKNLLNLILTILMKSFLERCDKMKARF